MDAKRLEELAQWATRQKETLESHEITDIAANYADLARCAAAWATLERMSAGLWALDSAEWGGPALCTGYQVGGYPTAIEAVESSQEPRDTHLGGAE